MAASFLLHCELCLLTDCPHLHKNQKITIVIKSKKKNNNNNINSNNIDSISKFSCKCFFFSFFQTDVPVYFVHFCSFMAKFSRPPDPGLFAWLQKLHTIDLSSRVRSWPHCLKPVVNCYLKLL